MAALTLPKLYAITDTYLSGLTHTEQVERLIAGGATLIQLREKKATPMRFYDDAARAITVARQHNARIIINDRVDIALALKPDGVHLGEDDLPAEKARDILGPDAIIGLSTHSIEQARRAMSLPVDYIAVGPIFATTTKENRDPTVGLQVLSNVKTLVGEKPVVAIGGIQKANILDVLAAGADSAAVISALVSEPDQIIDRTKELLNTVG